MLCGVFDSVVSQNCISKRDTDKLVESDSSNAVA